MNPGPCLTKAPSLGSTRPNVAEKILAFHFQNDKVELSELDHWVRTREDLKAEPAG